MKYDVVIVGAGLTGCTVARILKDRGKKVLIVERDRIGGNCRTEMMHNIEVHIHGPHTWHNSFPRVQSFMDRFTKFSKYRHVKFGFHGDTFYPFPLSLDTIREFDFDITEDDLKSFIMKADQSSFEAYLVSIVGQELFDLFYKNYSLKQWGTLDIPVDIAKRVPIHTGHGSNVFFDSYQAQPKNYNEMFDKMVEGIEIVNDNYLDDKDYYNKSSVVVYTGSLDEYFNYTIGALSYRTIRHQHVLRDTVYSQPCATLNYLDCRDELRSIEHKHFNQHSLLPGTVVSYEFVEPWKGGDVRYYPMWDYELFWSYYDMLPKNIFIAGRLGRYKYLDMNIAVKDAMCLAEILS